MRAGRLKHKVDIERLVNVGGAWGAATLPKWETWFSGVYVGLEPVGSSQRYQNNKHTNQTTHRVVMRYKKGLDASMRIKWFNKYLYINSIIDDNELHQELTLECWEQIL
jgi:SPP1 family predicted phage head-tail adaptor